MPVSFSFSVVAVPNSQPTTTLSLHEGEESLTARRELQLLEDHRPWEMLDNMALAIIDQTYAAVLKILRLRPPPQEGDRHVTLSVSQHLCAAADPNSPFPPPTLRVDASARHCCIYVMDEFHVGADIIRSELERRASPAGQRRSRWPPRHRLTRASIGAMMGTLYLTRVDGGGRDDYWKCADDEVRPDVSARGKGLVAVVNAIRSRLDAAYRLERRMLEMARAGRHRGAKAREIFRVYMALEAMRQEVDIDVILRRDRFLKRHRFGTISYRAEVEMDVDREDEEEVLSKRLKALHV
jgi:hypothetical protein